MSINKKQTSSKVSSLASEILKDKSTSKIAKSLAASALSQSGSKNQTGADMEEKAARVLQSDRYSEDTKTLAATVLSQSNKKR